MPALKPSETQQQDTYLLATVSRHLTLLGLSKNDLAIKMHMNYQKLHRRLKDPESLSLEELRRLAKVLKIEDSEKLTVW